MPTAETARVARLVHAQACYSDWISVARRLPCVLAEEFGVTGAGGVSVGCQVSLTVVRQVRSFAPVEISAVPVVLPESMVRLAVMLRGSQSPRKPLS